MRKLVLIGLAVGAIASHSLADGAALYKKCIVCHGSEGQTVALGKSQIIKDMTKEDFISSMKGYQDGTYGGPLKALMLGQVKGLSDEDINTLADHIIK